MVTFQRYYKNRGESLLINVPAELDFDMMEIHLMKDPYHRATRQGQNDGDYDFTFTEYYADSREEYLKLRMDRRGKSIHYLCRSEGRAFTTFDETPLSIVNAS